MPDDALRKPRPKHCNIYDELLMQSSWQYFNAKFPSLENLKTLLEMLMERPVREIPQRQKYTDF